MEAKKDVDVKYMINLITELSQESTEEQLDEALLTEEQSPTNEAILEEQICEENYQEYPDQVSHFEDLDEMLWVGIPPTDLAFKGSNHACRK
jgi:hypothetical protein